MDFAYLINILLRRKWLLLSVVLFSSIATWFFIGRLKPVFKAKAIISTGIIDYKGVSLQKDNPFIQKFQIESSFNGLTEKMKSRRSIKMLTERLLAHDVLADGIMVKPFRVPDTDEGSLSQSEIDHLAQKLKTNNTDTAINEKPHLERADNKLAEAYGYDYESILKKLEIQRIGETDYLSIEYKSESPELSFFVVNTFKEEFFKLHEEDLSHEENLALDFHTKQVAKRKEDLDAKILEINEYKRQNSLVDVSTQRETVISHLKDLELKKEEQNQQVEALQRQIPILNAKILEYNKVNLGDYSSSVFFSSDFQKLSDEIKGLQVKLIDQVASGNKNTGALEARIELLKEEQSKYISKSVPISSKTKEGMATQVRQWITESLEKQMELEFSKAAVRGFEAEIQKQQSRANKLLSDDSHLATLEADKYRLEQEYLRATKEYDDAKLYSEGTENPLAAVEDPEMPTEPESSHRALFSVFAGVASGTLTSIFLFLLAFVDSSIQSPSQFQRMTKLPLAGHVNHVKVKNMNLQHLFAHTQPEQELEIFKENIRKLRTTIENAGAKSILFTSPKEQEGKSFLIVLLAYAFSLNNKRILIIDTNFKNNTLSGFKTKSFIEINTDPAGGGYLGHVGTGHKQLPPVAENGPEDPYLKNIDIVGNKGGSQSPSEVLAGKDFKKVIEQYARKYDYIFLEAAAMNKYSDARELLPYTDKVLAVLSSQSPIGNADRDTLDFLRNLNGKMLGGILNNVDLKNI
ncbi:MAG: hypothetical protein H6577_23805 [Lewinellaceae bacterium]|nr:hypothetical protein [Saprospiraceae bacterium]MCB9341161.1 hypothetical protein [Lewinellaceae bacterium]